MRAAPDLLEAHEQRYRAGADSVMGHVPIDPQSPPSLLTLGAEDWAEQRRERLAAGTPLTVSDLLTGQLSVRRDVFNALGGFDEDFTRGALSAVKTPTSGIACWPVDLPATAKSGAAQRQQPPTDANSAAEVLQADPNQRQTPQRPPASSWLTDGGRSVPSVLRGSRIGLAGCAASGPTLLNETSLSYAARLQAWHDMNLRSLNTGGRVATARVSSHSAASMAEHSDLHVAHPCRCVGCDPHDAEGLHG